ncbi:hypothetical protein [Microbispora sp. NPDC049633]|uniref:hypothetical protein n=1 Tax=Microbispora sp. NPDC049633 TaxID=3154355 RepID=UPI00343DCC43
MSILAADGSIIAPYENFIATSRYSRYIDDLGRREVWRESVGRYMDFMLGHLKAKQNYVPSDSLVAEIRQAIENLDIVPSMRGIMTAGPALERSNIAGYNCSYLPVDDLAAFSETLYILLNGTGVGYSVERRYTEKLPPVAPITRWNVPKTIVFGDSKEGWAAGFREFLKAVWVDGEVPAYDLSSIRKAGSRLKTFGGRASGPEPLAELLKFTVHLLHQAEGRRLRPIEVHDLMCKIASVVVVGGVRRSAMIALTDVSDKELAEAKAGEWWETHPHRALANISAVFETHGNNYISRPVFDEHWAAMVASGSGERGIFNRTAAQKQASRWSRRDAQIEYGCNPCSEIVMRPFSFCNLSEVIVRPTDEMPDLIRKVELATVLGTWQATLTDFPFLRDIWKKNAEEERLLGVSLTGVFGNKITYEADQRVNALKILRSVARQVNVAESARVGITASHAITCVKPSGTVSQLAQVSSGIHPWHAPYYIRTVRADKKDPLAQLMADSGVPHEDDVTQPETTWVFSFPIAAPKGAVTRADLTAIQHLELWLDYQRHYCEHKPSVTINVKTEEWNAVGDWVFEHIDELSGVSFLPYAEHTYQQAPYQEVDQATYEAAVAAFPSVRWADLPFYEHGDQTSGSQELACSAGGCDVVDLVAA